MRINLSLKTLKLSPSIFGQFCEKTNIKFFSPKYLGLPVLTKYFVKRNCLCPEEGLHFRYFNLTLGHFGILKAVFLSIDWVKKLIQEICPTIEQKLVQHCETEVVADACNAS